MVQEEVVSALREKIEERADVEQVLGLRKGEAERLRRETERLEEEGGALEERIRVLEEKRREAQALCGPCVEMR